MSDIKTHLDASNVLALDDPELMKYPGRVHDRGRLLDDDGQGSGGACARTSPKGGFVIFDDFRDDFGNDGLGELRGSR